MSMFAGCTIQRTKTGIFRNNKQVCIIFNILYKNIFNILYNSRFRDMKEKWNFIIPVILSGVNRVNKLKYF